MAMSRFARSSSSARSKCSHRCTAAPPRTARSPRSASTSILTVTLSPARRARPPRSTSGADTSRTSPANASPGFAREDCEPCPLRPHCAPGGQRDIRIRRREDLRQAALRALSDPAQREHLYRTRPRIERLLGLIVHRYHGRKSRYFGARKSGLQAAGPPSWSTSTQSEPRFGPRRPKKNQLKSPTEPPTQIRPQTPAESLAQGTALLAVTDRWGSLGNRAKCLCGSASVRRSNRHSV